MKKWLKTIIPVFAFAFILSFPGIQAQAGTITSVNAEAGNNEFTVSGVAGDDILSVVIFVYDSTGENLLQMESVPIDSNHGYTDTFEVEEGTYVVKVADYEGGAFSETSVTVDSSNASGGGNNSNDNNNGNSNDNSNTGTSDNTDSDKGQQNPPNTSDTNQVVLWGIVLFMASLALAGSIIPDFKRKAR